MKGKSNKQIASTLKISQKTVEEHLTSIYCKIGTKSRAEAILWGLRDFPH
jgi:DNA-binding NarL/FixJ family response regulator